MVARRILIPLTLALLCSWAAPDAMAGGAAAIVYDGGSISGYAAIWNDWYEYDCDEVHNEELQETYVSCTYIWVAVGAEMSSPYGSGYAEGWDWDYVELYFGPYAADPGFWGLSAAFYLGWDIISTVCNVNGCGPWQFDGAFWESLGTWTDSIEIPPPMQTPAYSLSVSPDYTTVDYGGTATYTVAVNGTYFPYPVALDIEGLPPGALADFSPPIIYLGDLSSLSITTSSSNGVHGFFSLNILGDGNGIPQSVRATLEINPPPDFSISVSPTSQDVVYGGTATYTVGILPANGFSQGVSLGIEGLPPGATASFEPSTIAPGQTSTLRIVTSASSGAIGSFPMSISGQGGGLGRFVALTLQILNLEVLASGVAISNGDTVYIDSQPAMPALTARLVSGGAQLTGSTGWSFEVTYAYADTFNDRFPSSGTTNLPAANTWDITGAMGGAFVGGTAVVSATYGAVSFTLTFNIRGLNPPVTQIKNTVGTTPWYAQQIAKQESAYRQFDSSYMPLWGNPHGYGVMQYEGPTAAEVALLWNWVSNIQAGMAVMNVKQAGSYSFWTSQVQQWQTWNAANPNAQVGLAPNETQNSCTFGMTNTGSAPPGLRYFGDAISIKQYNGAQLGNYIAWDNISNPGGTPVWRFNRLNASGINYVAGVCGQTP